MPIKPGTDGALLLALVHEIIKLGLYDRDFLARYTNAGQLVNQDEASDDFGLMLRNPDGDIVNPLRPANFWWWDRHSQTAVADHTEGADPARYRALAGANWTVRCADDIFQADHSDKPSDRRLVTQAARLHHSKHWQVAPRHELGRRQARQ